MGQMGDQGGARAARIESIAREYLTALVEGRTVDLDGLLAKHAELMPELRAAIERADREARVARTPTATGATRETTTETSPVARERIGPYRLLEVLGEGGFGIVYLAERREPIVQRVAIKVIKPGMDSKAVIARFEQERQALAVMDHPNIARVFDAGTTERGLPYFVMEHVAGEPITDYCDRARLNLRQRLELFIPVCEAVQHAHHKGLIHRDLKPSNILVSSRDGKAHAKVIDFGVAKAISQSLTDKTVFTEAGQIIGTPSYMSPEQAEMGATDVDTRTDVYSLGVVLYELLSGLLPFDAKELRRAGHEAIRRILREREPARPSTRLSTADDGTASGIARDRQAERGELTRELRRELDWIPLKAMRKDRGDRYGSPAELARDVRNYLEGKVLEAGPVSAGYRLRKFVKRNRLVVVGVALFTAVITFGLLGTAWGLQEARREARAAREAEAHQRRLSQIAVQAQNEASEKRALAERKTEEAEVARENARFVAYLSNLGRAELAMAADESTDMAMWLEDCPTGLRGWEWNRAIAGMDGSLLVRTFSEALRRDASPRVLDGSVAFQASNELVISDLETNQRVAAFDRSRLLAQSMDHSHVAIESPSGEIQVWKLGRSATRVGREMLGQSFSVRDVSNDGSQVLFAGGRYIRIESTTSSGDPLFLISEGWNDLHAAVLSATGSQVAAASLRRLHIFETSTEKELFSVDHQMDAPTVLRFSPDGQQLLLCGINGFGAVFEVNNGLRPLSTLRGHTNSVIAADWSSDGSMIVTASKDRTARVWEGYSGREIAVLRGHRAAVTDVRFGADDRRVHTASLDGTTREWDSWTQSTAGVFASGTDEPCRWMFSPDGSVVASQVREGALLWDVASRTLATIAMSEEQQRWLFGLQEQPCRTFWCSQEGWHDELTIASLSETQIVFMDSTLGSDQVVHAMLSPNGQRVLLATGNGPIRLIDTTQTMDANVVSRRRNNKAQFGDFSDDSRRVFVYYNTDHNTDQRSIVNVSKPPTNPDVLIVIDATTGNDISLIEPDGTYDIFDAHFGPSGERIIARCSDGASRVWNASDGSKVASLVPSERKGGLDFWELTALHPGDAQALSVSEAGVGCVWDCGTGAISRLLHGNLRGVVAIAFSPDGNRLVTGADDGTIRLWHTGSGQEMLALRGHKGSIYSLAFSSDGTRILSASTDGTVRVWDSVPYRERFKELQARGLRK